MRRTLSRNVGLSGVLIAMAADLAVAQDPPRGVRLALTYGVGTRPGVIVLPAAWLTGDSIRTIIERDLDYGDRVTVIRAGDSLGVLGARGPMNYPLFARLGAAAVVQLSPSQSGVRAVLHDVGQKKIVGDQDFRLPLVAANTPDWRMGVHGVSDELETWITGARGIAQTRIAYTRGREMRIVDSDGANDRAVGTGMSPVWHPDGKHVAFTVLGDSGGRLGVRSLASGTTRWVVSKPYSVAITPAFSRDGSLLAYAYGEESGTDIYVVPALSSGTPRRITVGRGSENVNPSF